MGSRRRGQISSSGGSSSDRLFNVAGEVLRWAVIADDADDDEIPIPSSLPATKRLPRTHYDDPEEFAQLQSPLLAHEVFSQYQQALEDITYSTSSMNSAQVLSFEGLDLESSGSGVKFQLTIRIPGPNSKKYSSCDVSCSDLLLLSQYPLQDGLQSLRSFNNKTTIKHCLALITYSSANEDRDIEADGPPPSDVEVVEVDEFEVQIKALVATVWEWSNEGSGSLRALTETQVRQLFEDLVKDEAEQQKRQQSSPHGSWNLTRLRSLTTDMRVAEALAGFQHESRWLRHTISSVLDPSGEGECAEGAEADAQAEQQVCMEKAYLASRGLNPSQLGAALHAVTIARDKAGTSSCSSKYKPPLGSMNSWRSALSDSSAATTAAPKAKYKEQGPRVLLVQGPPGTGKTTTLAAMLTCLAEGTGPKERVLACAPTNAALGEVGRRVLGDIQNQQRLSDFRQSSLLPGCSLPLETSNTRESQANSKALKLSSIVLVAGSPAPGKRNTSAAAKLDKLLEPISLRPRVRRLKTSLTHDEYGLVPRADAVMARLLDAPGLHATAVKKSDESSPPLSRQGTKGDSFLSWLLDWLPIKLRALDVQAEKVQDDAPPSLFESVKASTCTCTI
jgi:hypothetical protein